MKLDIRILIIIITSSLLASCSQERRLAYSFVKEHKHDAVLLIEPEFIYKTSYKIPVIENFDALSQPEKDSIAYFSSDIVQYSNDSAYISNFMDGLNRGFRYFNFSVFDGASSSQFLSQAKHSHIFNVAQIQLEEYFDSINDDTSYDLESQNPEPMFITAINMNNWIEYTKVNHEKSPPIMLFNSQTITDDFNGHFLYYPMTGEFDFKYVVDSLTVDKLYSSARTLGFRYSQWLFDYLMNDYIKVNLPEGKLPNKLYTFDFEYRIVKRLKWEPFTPIVD